MAEDYPEVRPYGETDKGDSAAKKKKLIIGGVVGLVVIGVIILIICLSGGNPDDPGNSSNPLDFEEFNPFTLTDESFGSQDWYINGILENTKEMPNPETDPEGHDKFLRQIALQYNRLQLEDDEMVYRPVNPRAVPVGENNKIPDQVSFNFSLVNNYEMRLQIGALNGQNYSVTNETQPRIVQEFEARMTQLGFELSQSGSAFDFTLRNIYNDETILTTKNRKFVIQEKFSELGMVLPNNRIFGLGTSNRKLQLKTDSTYTLWSKGSNNETLEEDEGRGGQHGSQVHPFILGQAQNRKDWYGIFFLSGAAQSFELISVPDKDEVILNYITLGDQIEFYVIMRGTPQEIIANYQHQIGYPSLPPYFQLGVFAGSHDDKWPNTEAVNADIEKWVAAKIPIEGVLLDSYTINDVFPFTQNTLDSGFGNIDDVATKLRSHNMKMLLGVQSALPTTTVADYQWLQKAKDYNCLILQDKTLKLDDSTTLGSVLQYGTDNEYSVALIDYFKEAEATKFLKEALDMLASYGGGFDGLYLRGNSPVTYTSGNDFLKKEVKERRSLQSAFGESNDENNPENKGDYKGYKFGSDDQKKQSFSDIPFTPGYDNGGPLDNQTIDMSLIHEGFENTSPAHKDGVPHFYVHNLYGYQNLKLVYNYLMGNNTARPNIFSESTWPGAGLMGGSFTPLLENTYDNIKHAVAMAMNMGFNGVNNWVTEVASTTAKPEDEVMLRLIQTAAFLPMIRLEGEVTTNLTKQDNIIASLKQRLPFTRYIYSQMFQANYTGGSVVYPLLFDYPEDDNLVDKIEETFMLGDALKISPALSDLKYAETYQSYFPAGTWRDPRNRSNDVVVDEGKDIELTLHNDTTQVHMAAGKIIPIQWIDDSVVTTKALEETVKMSFVVSMDDSLYADGFVLIDDGISHANFANNAYTFWKIRYAEGAINFWVERGDFLYDVYKNGGKKVIDQLEKIEILDADKAGLDKVDNACYMGRQLQPKPMTFKYDKDTNVMTITPTETLTFRDIGFIKLVNSKTEPNVCDTKGFTYYGQKLSTGANDTYQTFKLTPALNDGNLETLYVAAQLLDDDGTLNINVTTKSDWNDETLFRAPHVQDLSRYPNQKDLKKKLDDFVKFEASDDSKTQVPFAYNIINEGKADEVLYRMDPNQLYLTQYLVFDNGIFDMNEANENPLIGIGERAGDLFFKDEVGAVHSRWAHDAANPIDDGIPPGRNMYGVQPFYVFQDSHTNWFGVFNNNPYATDYIVYTNEGKQSNITTVMIGGMIEKYFFRGAKPDDVIVKYTKLTGMPTMQPLWAFGWQQCRFGWVTDEYWEDVVDKYEEFKLPIDTMWADIDYMDDYKLFTISQSRYKRLPELVDGIRKKNMTFVPIMDAGVAVRPNSDFKAYDKGMEMQIFIKQAESDDPLTAGVWCGNAYFPDFYHPDGERYWHGMWKELEETYGLHFDGIWLDENEATNFCDGYCIPEERPNDSLRNKPYYIPGQRDLESESLGVDGRHANGRTEFDVHNTFALMQSKATADYLAYAKGLRPYVLSRSNSPGLQKYAHHWIGDNWSWVEYMIASVKNVYEYQIFGLPFMGSDLCGFNGDAPADLCTRWHQLGTLFPWSRNHNQNATASQEPYRFNTTVREGEPTTYTDLIRTAIQNKYTILRYYYSTFWEISEFGGSFFKPIFFEWPADLNGYHDIERNIMLGPALKASVETTRLTDGETKFYFPEGKWCQILPYLQDMKDCLTGDGTLDNSNITLRTNMEDYYVHLRNGYVVPMQNQSDLNVQNTKAQFAQRMDLYMIPNAANAKVSTKYSADVDAAAMGYIYFDDGVTFEQNQTRFDMFYSFNADKPTTVAEFTIKEVTDYKGKGYTDKTKSMQVGSLLIFNPFNDAIDNARVVQKVEITYPDSKGKATTADITGQAKYVDESKKMLAIDLTRGDPKDDTHFRFEDVTKVTITYPDA